MLPWCAQKIALGDSLEDEAEDDTAVDVAGIDRHRGVLTQFRDAVFGADYEERKAAAAAGKKAAPKRKDAPEVRGAAVVGASGCLGCSGCNGRCIFVVLAGWGALDVK